MESGQYPQRRGLPDGVPNGSGGGRTEVARAARSEMTGQHESSGGVPAVRRVSTSEAEGCPPVGHSREWRHSSEPGA